MQFDYGYRAGIAGMFHAIMHKTGVQTAGMPILGSWSGRQIKWHDLVAHSTSTNVRNERDIYLVKKLASVLARSN